MGSSSSLTQKDLSYVLKYQPNENSLRKKDTSSLPISPEKKDKPEPSSIRKNGRNVKVIPVKSPRTENIGPNSARRQPISSRIISSDISPLSARGGNGGTSARGNNQTSKRIVDSNTTQPHVAELGAKYSFSTNSPWIIKTADFSKLTFKDFEYLRVIGQGLMGTVRICKTKQSKKYFVLKSINKENILKHKDVNHVISERNILLNLSTFQFCSNIFGTFQDKYNVYFALEYVPGGELFYYIRLKKHFSNEITKFFAMEIFYILYYLHSNSIVYRDLKPENILIDDEGHCKIIDFGFSTYLPSSGRMKTICGTPCYLSPEQLDSSAGAGSGYKKDVDFWAYGVLLYEMLTGKTPFMNKNTDSNYEIFLRILNSRIKFPRNIDSKAKNIISNLCHSDMNKRLVDPEEIKSNKYFDIPWSVVGERRLIPHFIPRLHEGHDQYFEKFNPTKYTPGDFGCDFVSVPEAFYWD